MSTTETAPQSPIAGPSPLDMPGAQVSTVSVVAGPDGIPAKPKAPAPVPAQPEAPAADGLSLEDRNELERLRAIHKDEQKWEKRAKENFAARQQLDKLAEALGGRPEEGQPFDPQAEISRLRAEIDAKDAVAMRERVARTTGVPPSQIHGTDEASMTASANEALAWAKDFIRQQGVPLAAPAANVTSNQAPHDNGVKQIQTRDELKNMSSAQVMEAYRNGQLANLGAAPPK